MANHKIYKVGGEIFVEVSGVIKKYYINTFDIDISQGIIYIADLSPINPEKFEFTLAELQDSAGVPVGDLAACETYLSNLKIAGTTSISGGSLVDLATNDLGRTVWGVPKVSLDHSIFHGMWSFSVPIRMWLQYNDIGAGFIEQTTIDNTLVKSVNGMLFVGGNATTDVRLSSRRHLRYQPNRGLLFSTALAMPDPTKVERRRFGLKTNGSNGIVFELEGDGTAWTLSIIKITTVDGVASEIKTDITDKLPIGFDPAKGPTYDIQMQWRGFGDFIFYISLNEVYVMSMLDTLTRVSISNPALSVTFESLDNLTPSAGMFVGCVDVTSEGGRLEDRLANSIDTGTTLLSVVAAGTALLAIKMPETILYNGNQEPYTRDILIKKLSTYCRDEAFRTVYYGRTIVLPNLDALTWQTGLDSDYQYAINTAGAVDTAFQLDKANMNSIYSVRSEKDISVEYDFSFIGNAPRYLVGGEILVVEIKPDNTSTAGLTFDFDEEM